MSNNGDYYEDFTGLDEDEPRQNTKGREFYWLLAVDRPSGRPIILGPYDTESEANRIGFEKIDSGNFEVVPLATHNVQRANQLLKYRRFNQTSKLEEVLKRAKHILR